MPSHKHQEPPDYGVGHFGTRCGTYSALDVASPYRVQRPTKRQPNPIHRAVCGVCGHYSVITDERDERADGFMGRCSWCGREPSAWAFLSRLATLPWDMAISLHCPYHKPHPPGVSIMVPTDPCEGTQAFVLADLLGYYCTGGNGPYTYPLFCRFNVQGHCAPCGHRVDDFTRYATEGNRQLLLALLPPLPPPVPPPAEPPS